MESGDFSSFLERMGSLSYAEMLRQSLAECAKAEARSTQTTNGQSYAARIKNFVFFLQENKRPSNVTADDFYAYKPIVAALITRGEFRESALEVFGSAL